MSRSNENSEGFNKWFKERYFNNKCVEIRTFIRRFFNALNDISSHENPVSKPFPDTYKELHNWKIREG